MSKDQYKAWLTSVPEQNTKANETVQKCFTVQHERSSLKKPRCRKKHITVVTQTQKTDSVTDFFTVMCGAMPGTSSSASLGEPSTPLVSDAEDVYKDSRSVATHRNAMTKFAIRKEQHKADILWALKCVMSHLSFN